jgi:hypothetical protein
MKVCFLLYTSTAINRSKPNFFVIIRLPPHGSRVRQRTATDINAQQRTTKGITQVADNIHETLLPSAAGASISLSPAAPSIVSINPVRAMRVYH